MTRKCLALYNHLNCRFALTLAACLTVGSVVPAFAADEGRELNYTVTVPLSIADSFELWVSPVWAKQFLALDVKIDPRVGGQYVAVFDPVGDPEGAYAGTYGSKIREIQPPVHILFEWNYLTPREATKALGGQRLHQESLVDVRFERISAQCTAVHIRHFGIPMHEHGTASFEFYRDSGWPWIIKRLNGMFGSPHYSTCQ